MRKFKGQISTDKVGSKCIFEFEVEDDDSVDDIDEAARQAAFNHVEWSYEEIKEI